MFHQPLDVIKGIIFDLDGTLLTSSLDFKVIREQIHCPSHLDVLSFIAGLPAQTQEVANQVVLAHEMADAQDSMWISGAEQAIASLKKRQIPIAIVTRNSKQATLHKLKNNKLVVDTVITREDAPPKPNPNALLKIAKDWGLPVQQVAYIGDYLYDIQAANNADMFAGLYAPNEVPNYAHLAHWVFNHFDQFTGLIKT
ncbi:MAG: HAD-IA family hydrolase [Paraglaciecola sp.]|uniref:HAD family hydrolase n=1 Tax=Paraglaciecola sp. TaxID=1920173 RepID=UPI00273EA951|nr:HAD-IA family hydrolase [Paraglaciecola sp.]MDP5032644.1 HAD-IA family hydrolase [Paraglaciecola sp.]MDP5132461.1 HAD-IA family hydrolase [Paraglaciecola sp.]